MKAKTLAMTAVICAASIFGTSFATAYAAPFSYDLQATQIENNIETQPLSQKVRERNEAIGAVLGIAAIAAIANHYDKHHNYDNDRNYNDRNRHDNYNHDRPNRPSHGHYRR